MDVHPAKGRGLRRCALRVLSVVSASPNRAKLLLMTASTKDLLGVYLHSVDRAALRPLGTVGM